MLPIAYQRKSQSQHLVYQSFKSCFPNSQLSFNPKDSVQPHESAPCSSITMGPSSDLPLHVRAVQLNDFLTTSTQSNSLFFQNKSSIRSSVKSPSVFPGKIIYAFLGVPLVPVHINSRPEQIKRVFSLFLYLSAYVNCHRYQALMGTI